MTQAYNLALLANAVDTSGRLNVGTNATGTLPVANGGTGTSSPSLVAGTGISITGSFPNQTIAATVTGGQLQNQLFTSGTSTWTAPAGVTRVKATVIGGGGGGSAWSGSSGGGGGFACAWVTVTPGTGYTVTVGGGGFFQGGNGFGGSGGTSSFGSFLSATGGGGGSNNTPLYAGNGSGTVSSGTALMVGNTYGGRQYRVDTDANYSPPPSLLGYADFAGPWGRGYSSGATNFSGTLGFAAGTSNPTSTTGGVGGLVYLEWVG